MAEFRYSDLAVDGWFKGNTHIHSTVSDGGKTFAEIADLYADDSYDFLFRTDHWVASDVETDDAAYPLLWLDGVELDGHDDTGASFHVVCLGKCPPVDRSTGLVETMAQLRAAGALTILAHPHWCGNSMTDALRHAFDGVEIYNHVCHWLNGKSYGGPYWSAMLAERPATLGFAADDSHLRSAHPGWNGGWIAVNADELSRTAIMQAIKAGRFYSSCGPTFHEIRFEPPTVTFETSPIRFARLVGPGSQGLRTGSFHGPLISGGQFELPTEWPHAILEIEDSQGRRAWTNSLLLS